MIGDSGVGTIPTTERVLDTLGAGGVEPGRESVPPSFPPSLRLVWLCRMSTSTRKQEAQEGGGQACMHESTGCGCGSTEGAYAYDVRGGGCGGEGGPPKADGATEVA